MLIARPIAVLTLLCLAVFSTSCYTENTNVSGTRGGVKPSAGAPPHTKMQYDKAVIVDDNLQVISGSGALAASKIYVEKNHAQRTDTDTLEVVVVVRNRTDYPQQIQGRTTFLDGAFVPVEPISAWKRIMLPANSIGVYREYSTSTIEVAHFYTEIREGD